MSPGLRRAFLYGVLALCLCGFAWVSGRSSAIDDLTLDRAQSLANGHRGYERVVDSLLRVSQGAKARADSLAQHPRYVQVVTAHHDTVTMLDTVWVAQQVTALGTAYQACSEGLMRCRARGDSLQASLEAVLKVKECHILFVSCPSRTAFFVIGAVSGAILEHRLSR